MIKSCMPVKKMAMDCNPRDPRTAAVCAAINCMFTDHFGSH